MKRKLVLVLIAALALLIVGVALLVVLWRRTRPEPRPVLPQVFAPDGAQLLRFPLDDGLMIAGYLNPNYREKHGYPHYGIDITTASGGRAEILASGDGVVLGTEFCDNNLGHIALIRYDDVFVPGTGETLSLVGRYYHMTTLHIAPGDRVHTGQVIGEIDRGHKWYNHIHLEFDADLDYPFHTPQVAEATSELLHRYPATGEQMLDPLAVLAEAEGQYVRPNHGSALCAEEDAPRYASGG